MTYTTETTHTQTSAGNRDFSVGFPFLATTDIKVQLNGVTKTVTNDYTIVQSGANTTVNFNIAPASNDTIRIFRDTDIDAIEATYAAGSAIRSTDLNTNNTQLLYAAQEFGTLKSDNSVSFTLGDKGDIAVNSSTDWTLQNNSVELANMADNSVDTNELVNYAVIDDKMANDAIATRSIKDNAVTLAKMADNSVGTSELVNDAVTLDKITDLITSKLVPTGTVIWYAGTSAPTGYLKANGDAIANGNGTTQGVTTNFSALYAVVGANLPDLRGEFVRGWDDGKGTDSGRNIRSSQSDQNKQHNHTATSSSTTASKTLTGTFGSDPHDYTPTGIASWTNQTMSEDADQGNNGRVVTINATHDHTTTTTTSIANDGGTEVRTRNIALLACIKY